jgi:hypothetical protein
VIASRLAFALVALVLGLPGVAQDRLMRRATIILTMLTIAHAGMAGSAWAWGDQGHAIVGIIASHYLTPTVKRKVVLMLAADPDNLTGHSIANETVWADRFIDSDRSTTKVRYNQTRSWHFVDIELHAPDLNAACFGHLPLPMGTLASLGGPDACVVDKIIEFAAELSDPATPDSERLLALKFLLHFLGDMHQPLHASDEQDAGGNRKNVISPGLEAGNLHGYWDTTFVQQLGADAFDIADALRAKITKVQIQQWSKGSPKSWAMESFALARTYAYGKLPPADGQGRYMLSAAYVAGATKIVAEQLSKAGVRLAVVLNRALAD